MKSMAKALEMGMARLKGGEKEETRNLFRRWGREPKTKVVFQRVDVQEGRRLWVGLWLYRYGTPVVLVSSGAQACCSLLASSSGAQQR